MELAKLMLQAIQLIVVTTGLGYTAYQIRLLRISYRDLHDWNRRKSAQDAIEGLTVLAPVTKVLNEHFDFLENNDPIPLEILQQKCEQNVELRGCIHKLLNTYEDLAVGVFQRVYDESIIYEAMGWVIPTTLHQFNGYIRHKRLHGSANAWTQVERLSMRWSEDRNRAVRERDMTGVEVGLSLPWQRKDIPTTSRSA